MNAKRMAALLPLMSGTLLMSCNDATPVAKAEAPTKGIVAQRATTMPKPAQTAAQADVWVGEYGAKIEGGKGSMTIKPDGKAYHVGVATFGHSDGCGGMAEGRGIANGDIMTVNVVAEYLDSGSCQMTVTRSGNQLTVDSGSCFSMTGASCTLSGNYTRIGAVKRPIAPVPAAAPTKAALIGVWVDPQYGCEGDGGLFLRADGTWGRNGHHGPWSLNGTALKLVTTTIEDDDSQPQKVSPPTTEAYTVTTIKGDRMTLRDAAGGTENYMRCH